MSFAPPGADRNWPEENHFNRLSRQLAIVESAIEQLEAQDGLEKPDLDIDSLDALNTIEKICIKFHRVARQLSKRYGDRQNLEVKDEYDDQYLLHALLWLFFDDIRPEETTPSYAGKSSRIDFLLKAESIGLEVKKTGKGLSSVKDVGDQLLKIFPDIALILIVKLYSVLFTTQMN
jgi:hypothetical protein